jgi:hypothetical protein
MSQENVELAHQAYHAFNRRDLGHITLGKIEVGGHAADSGIAVRQTAWHVWRWRRKKAVWFGFFPTEATALEAVRLQE